MVTHPPGPISTCLRRSARVAALLAALSATGAVAGIRPARCRPWQSFARPGIFWRIQRRSGPRSYLLGTIHSDHRRVLSLVPAVQSSLRRSSVFVMETRLTPQAIATLRRAMRLPQGNLSAILGPALYARVRHAFARRGWSASALAHEAPWALLITLGVPQAHGPVLDQVLARNAHDLGLPVVGLESTKEQIDALRTLPVPVQKSLLNDALDYSADAQLHALIRRYAAQDLRGLMRAAGDDRKPRSHATRIFFRRLLHDRNRRMVARLLPILARGRTFVAVGALHLPGFLSRLGQAGYCARPIRLRTP